jgi:ribosomal protein S18 acetylase RimI-like enzyme
MAFRFLETRIEQLRWHRQKHGVRGAVTYLLKSLAPPWVIRREHIFVTNLHGRDFAEMLKCDLIAVEPYSSLESIPPEDFEKLASVIPPASLRYFQSAFARGARLWLGRHEGKLVGYKWTQRGGAATYFPVLVPEGDVVSFAGQIFPEFRGQRFWQRMTAAVYAVLKTEGVSRVYMNVRSRNHSMLKGMHRAGVPLLGQIIAIRLPGYRATIWKKQRRDASAAAVALPAKTGQPSRA